jgi:hypothetical protein
MLLLITIQREQDLLTDFAVTVPRDENRLLDLRKLIELAVEHSAAKWQRDFVGDFGNESDI